MCGVGGGGGGGISYRISIPVRALHLGLELVVSNGNKNYIMNVIGCVLIFLTCSLSWLKLSMMTPMKRFNTKNDPDMMKTMKYM